MKKVRFYPKNSSTGVSVNNRQDIIACMGELGYNIQSIDILENGLVIGYIEGQGFTLGHIVEE